MTVYNQPGFFSFRFAGVLNGMTTTLASLAALLSPIITSELTKTVSLQKRQSIH